MLPAWVWLLAVPPAAGALLAVRFFRRFRGACARTRSELAALLAEQHPELTVRREELGNLVLGLPDGGECVWEMADLYAEVARLPGMDAAPDARRAVYQRALDRLLLDHPALPLGVRHRDHLFPRLVRPGDAGGGARRALPELGLEVQYVVRRSGGSQPVGADELAALGLDEADLHGLALENLRRDFPSQMVRDAASGRSGTAVQFGDGLDAARLLLVPGYLEPGEGVVALVPHADLLLLLPGDTDPARAAEGVGLLDCPEHARLLTGPVRVSRDGFTPFA